MTAQSLKRCYKGLALIVLNTIVIVVVIDIVCAIAIRIKNGPARTHNPIGMYGKARILQGYPGRPEAEVIALLHETWDEMDLRSEFDELTEFKEAPFRGRFVNVNPAGFRENDVAAPWPPNPANLNIFVFGGSTTFGYGLPDNETLPTAIQQRISTLSGKPVFAYNFGRGSYFSTQELMLYYSLLSSGRVPQVAIFVDGLNDFAHLNGELDNTEYLKSLVQQDQGESSSWPMFVAFVNRTAMARATRWLRARIAGGGRTTKSSNVADESALTQVCNRWFTNKYLIERLSTHFKVKVLFVWQPVPTYRYDYERYHLLRDLGFEPLKWGAATRAGYPLMARSRPQLERDKNFLWLADMQERRFENLYVDEFHYTAAFMRDIAGPICRYLEENDFIASERGDFALRTLSPPTAAVSGNEPLGKQSNMPSQHIQAHTDDLGE